MPIFVCSNCKCIDNTATSGYWTQRILAHEANEAFKPRCSECNPEIGKWHGLFEKKSAVGYFSDSNGFLWSREEVDRGAVAFALGALTEIKRPA